jgi:hypothetical protein
MAGLLVRRIHGTGRTQPGLLIMRKLITILAFSTMLSGCGKGDSQQDSLDLPSNVKVNPKAPAPTVAFPRELQKDDSTLNKFIEDALSICAEGDYDRFRQLFGAAYAPPTKEDFDKIWAGVKSIEIVSVHPDPREKPPIYYVHANVLLRQADPHGRTKRDAIVAVFQENGQWRLSPPSKEIVHKVLLADSRPADGAASRPSTRPSSSLRPASQPGV